MLRLDPGETKNGKGREFPLYAMPELRAVIEAQRTHVSEIERKTGRIISHVFVNDAGRPLVDFRNRLEDGVPRGRCTWAPAP